MKITNLLMAAAFTVAGTVASAATIAVNAAASQGIDTISAHDFGAELLAAGATTLYTGPLTLTPSGPVRLTFSLVGAESGFQNTLAFDGAPIIAETANGGEGTDFLTNTLQGQTSATNFFGSDVAAALSFLAFDFSTGTEAIFTSLQNEFSVFADANQADALDVFFLALDDDGANFDNDRDDIIVRVNVAAVPLPASGLLLLAGLGGLYGARRRSKKA